MRLTISGKLLAAVCTTLVLALSAGFLWVLAREDRQATADFRRELSTITGYAQSVREFLAQHVLPSADSLGYHTDTIPVVASWRTARLYASKKGYTFTTPSLAPRNPDNGPDGFERRALEAFQSYPLLEEYDEILSEGGVGVLRYAVPIWLTQDCLVCHGGADGELDRFGQRKEGMSLGDLKGAFVVTAPLASLVARLEGNQRSILWIGLVIIAATGCVTFVAIRGVLRPLKELLEAIRRIGVGQIQERLSIRSRDEVGELAHEFNQMAGRLESSYATLEKRVQERTRALERSQAQLVQASKLAALGELVGGIAHEINNPTGIIVMRSASLMQEAQAEGLSIGLVDDVEVIQRQSAKIAQITSGLLAFSRQAPFSPQPADINRTITNAVGLVENVLRSRDIAYRADLADRLPLVQADTTRVEQVLLNLINNSMDAMPGGGELSVSTTLEADGDGDRWVRIAMRDTGVGIPEEHMDRLFDPFFTTKDVGKGTGLGLAISYGIVQEHGGRLEVVSTLGEGAVFYVCLPVDGGATEV